MTVAFANAVRVLSQKWDKRLGASIRDVETLKVHPKTINAYITVLNGDHLSGDSERI